MNGGASVLRTAVFALILLLVGSTPLLGAAEAENVVFSPVGWVFRWINAAILFGALGYLIWKKGRAGFRRRAETISGSIAESAQVKAAAEARLREAEQKLARLAAETAGLRAEAQREAAAEAERIRALARTEAAKIERAGQSEIEAAERAARMELRAMAARSAVARAEALIRQRLTPELHAEIFRSFVSGLGGTVN